MKFTNDGIYLKSFAEGAFLHPEGITIDPSGNIYVADRNHDSVKKYDNSGNLLLDIGGFYEPNGVAVDSSGNVYIATNKHIVANKGLAYYNLRRFAN